MTSLEYAQAPVVGLNLPEWFSENSSDCIKVIDLGGNIVHMNTPGLRALEVDSAGSVLGSQWSRLWPEASRSAVLAALREAATGTIACFRAACPTAKGTAKWWDVKVHPVKAADGSVDHFLVVSRDITDLQQAHTELQAEKEIMRLATQAAGLGLWRYTPHLAQFDFQNNLALDIFGLAPSCTTLTAQQTLHEHIHPEDQERLQAALHAACAESGQMRFQGRIRLPDSTVRWMEMFGRVHRPADDSPLYLLGTVADVTDRKTVEENLHNAQVRLAATLDAGEVATWTWDIQANHLSGDRNIAYLFSLPEEVAANTPIETFLKAIHPDDIERVSARIQQAISDRAFYQETYRVLARDGKYHWVTARGRVEYDEMGVPLQLPGVVLDVTLQKEAEEKLHASEERYRALFESIDEGFCIIEILYDADGQPADYRFKESNSAFLIQGGYEATPEKTVLEIFPDLERRWIHLYAEVARTGRPVRTQDQVTALNRWFDIHAVRVGGTGSSLVAVLFSDITERRQNENDLRRLAFSLAETDQRKTEFLATLAHELRNPLAPIRNGLQLLRLAGNDQETVARVREMMERQVTQMVHLVNDLLDIARISSGKVELKKTDVDLKNIVATAIEASLPAIQFRHHDLNVVVPEEPFPLSADPTRIAQVIGNLLSNAAKYTPEGGRIELTLHREGDGAVLQVTDNGIGIPAEAQSTVFDMFAQVKANMNYAHGGLGIGLALVQSLVYMHGGRVAVSSAGSGQGSTFTIRLPLNKTVESTRHVGSESQPETAAPFNTRLRVLIVDDNEDGATSLGALIELGGHEVRLAHTGQQGMEMVEEFRPDIVFLDIGLPDMDGYAVVGKIRQLPYGKKLPVAALTGWGAKVDRIKTTEAGFDHHLVKPAPLPMIEKLLSEFARKKAT
ncbi:PAS domain-containing hybrid sensor histidine kinase/response regulator [Noviherbaspirillum pedocola]|uniref:histidine kinase n=1 Tax=Noviherbaspirillum pedocola TaxID=2801341 RepID=A0A934T467_9BURK|nr:PAS domain S-box protein [Noviherbaspirillum pedocola]MBK4738773.1 PAS domain S-box protein [Noviherbaspirillum pedocola]